MTVVMICIMHYGFLMKVQKDFMISCMLVIGIKVSSSVVDAMSWSYANEIFPSNLRGMGFGVVI